MDALRENISLVHTTDSGAVRIAKNLSLDTGTDVVKWCREKIMDASCVIERRGKNWYVVVDGCVITVNAGSYTIITAHKVKRLTNV